MTDGRCWCAAPAAIVLPGVEFDKSTKNRTTTITTK